MTVRRAVVVVGIVVAMGIAPTQAAQAAFPGLPGRIAFNNLPHAGGYENNVYTSRIDGTSVRQLTTDFHSKNPAWSPDGTQIAFNRHGDIFVMSATGTDVRRVTTLGASYQPAWSPTGNRLLFVHAVGGFGTIWVVPAAGGQARQLTHDGSTSTCWSDGRPTWSPLGGKIAYEQRSGPNCVSEWPRVKVLDLSSRTSHVITYADHPDFTADGRGIFFGDYYDTEAGYEIPYNEGWSNLRGGNRSVLTNFFCAEGDSCFEEGVAAPDSAFPSNASFLWIATNSNESGSWFCLATPDPAKGSDFRWCSDYDPAIWPIQVSWRSLPST
jgi:dipeptidyl aminopeptidase/acylaminoacyl peptidase